LACASNNEPYVVPVYLAYHESPVGEQCLYGYTTVGQKVNWMRANPRVCVEVDDVQNCARWTSVIVFGRYEELPDPAEATVGRAPERAAGHHYDIILEEAELQMCYQLQQTQALWWEPASTTRAALAHRDPTASFVPMFYRIVIDRVTGHEATPDACSANMPNTATPSDKGFAGLRRALSEVWRGHRTRPVSAK
jgi:nitroimidazol reductase NimA-like FMN-containing flavoprotein (pyridoxamine 5'-phosphate oxidase superfamily)